MISLIKLTENDKRILIAVFIIIIIIFVLIGLLANIIRRIMAHQGKAVDTYMFDMVKAKVITTPRQFRKIGRIKNFQYLYKRIRLPLILLTISFLICLVRFIVTKDSFFATYFTNDKGIGSLFYQWDWKNAEKASFLGIPTHIPTNWPEIKNIPHFETNFSAITAYLSFLPLIVGLILYLKHLVAFISRSIQTAKLSRTVFQKNLSSNSETL